MSNMKISAPWWNYYRQIKALFSEDPEIKVIFDDEAKEVKLFVDNGRKADAIAALLPDKKVFGNIEVKVTVVPANNGMTKATSLIADAFAGNPALVNVLEINSPLGEYDYVIFKNKVVQYFNDDLSDVNGACSTLYQNLAKELFEDAKVFFCTEAGNDIIKKPLGEWP
jgi:hypothetical protein